jgi:hypothetical protein
MDIKFLFLLGVVVVLWIIMRLVKKRKGLHNFFVIIFSIFVTLVVIETAYRFFLKKNAFTMKSNKSFGTYTQHPVTGYMIADAGETQMAKIARNGDTIYSCTYTLIPDSGAQNIQLNHRAGFKSTSNDSAEIVFLGCSITFGEGLNDNQTFAYKTGELCNTSSINFGLSGYGTHQAYAIYKNHFEKTGAGKKRTVIYSFIPDHILRAKCIYPWNTNDPYYEISEDSLLLKGKASANSGTAKTHKYTRYLSLFNSFTFITDLTTSIVSGKAASNLQAADYNRVFSMMQNMERSAKAQNEQFVLIYWDKYQWKETDDSKILDRGLIERNIEDLKKQGVIVIKASEAMDINNQALFIKGDGHPTAEANELLAKKIAAVVCGK